MYECAICQSINHSSRLHCSVCGAVPKEYSWTGTPVQTIYFGCAQQFITIVAAIGCERTDNMKPSHIKLRTVSLDYYSEV